MLFIIGYASGRQLLFLKGVVKNSGSCHWSMGALWKLCNQLSNSICQISLSEIYSRQLKRSFTAFCEAHGLISLFSREHCAINQVDVTKTYSLKILFKVILRYTLIVSKWSLSLSVTRSKSFMNFSGTLCILYNPSTVCCRTQFKV